MRFFLTQNRKPNWNNKGGKHIYCKKLTQFFFLFKWGDLMATAGDGEAVGKTSNLKAQVAIREKACCVSFLWWNTTQFYESRDKDQGPTHLQRDESRGACLFQCIIGLIAVHFVGFRTLLKSTFFCTSLCIQCKTDVCQLSLLLFSKQRLFYWGKMGWLYKSSDCLSQSQLHFSLQQHSHPLSH